MLDPTRLPPAGYERKDRADAVYGDAFLRCFEYLSGSKVEGDVLEFGVYQGYTARLFALCLEYFKCPGTLRLYDSFEGLPQLDDPVDKTCYETAVSKTWVHRQMELPEGVDLHIRRALGQVIEPERVVIVKGFFDETLADNAPPIPAALIHIDCDLYASTSTVLDFLLKNNLLVDGAVLLFDDFNCNRANPEMGERRALRSSFAKQSTYTYSPWFSYGWHGMAFFVHRADSGTSSHA